jgi:hypothetical protein
MSWFCILFAKYLLLLLLKVQVKIQSIISLKGFEFLDSLADIPRSYLLLLEDDSK